VLKSIRITTRYTRWHTMRALRIIRRSDLIRPHSVGMARIFRPWRPE